MTSADTPLLFPFSEYWWLYLGFIGFVLLMLALDLGIFHRKAHVVGFKEALGWSIVWVCLALTFNAGLYFYSLWSLPHAPHLLSIPGFDPQAAASRTALEFLTGYVVEKSLSVDNIFVFVVVFNFFAVPAQYQHRVLFYGILGALIFRILFISLGSLLLQYHIVILVFGLFLVLTGIKILFAPEKPLDPSKNPLIRLLKKIVPVSSDYDGQRFFSKPDGVWHATPLFLALVLIEFSDIIFAIDSVPAIFAITKEPLIVFTSNIFAILGLRAMFFLLADVVDKFRYLKYGLGLVLIFVGLKMAWLNEACGGKFPITWSLGIIVGIVGLSIALSFLIPVSKKEA